MMLKNGEVSVEMRMIWYLGELIVQQSFKILTKSRECWDEQKKLEM